MTITFENDSDVIVYALEKLISYARRTQQIFVAQCIWWLSSVIGLESGLVIHIDNLRTCEPLALSKELSGSVHPDSVQEIQLGREVSSTSRDLTADLRLDQVLEEAEKCITTSERARNTWQRNRVNPLPQSKTQLKKARKVKHLQEANRITEAKRNKATSGNKESSYNEP
jgi:hypothetical protein